MSEKDESAIRRDNLSNWRDEATLAFIICGRFSESRELGNSFCTDLVNKLNIFLSHRLNEIEASCQKRGLYLFSGPVGSGKTTTMYRVAKQRSGEQQVIAIEDPVEIEEKQFYSCKQMKNSVNL